MAISCVLPTTGRLDTIFNSIKQTKKHYAVTEGWNGWVSDSLILSIWLKKSVNEISSSESDQVDVWNLHDVSNV